jgi:rod shape-determining protein MreD
VVAIVTYVALTRRAWWGVAVGLLAGLSIDSLAACPFGTHAAAGVATGFLIGNVWSAVYRDRWPAQVACLLVAVLLWDSVAWIVMHGVDATLGSYLFHRSLPAALASAILCPPLFALTARVFHVRIRWEHAGQSDRRHSS